MGKRNLSRLKHEDIERIQWWLSLPPKQRREKCPFNTVSGIITKCAICADIFPKVNAGKSVWLSTKERYVSYPCPCNIMDEKYVTKVARKIVIDYSNGKIK